jgi:ABC-type multidrug transport system fused ATPase/permease subunit
MAQPETRKLTVISVAALVLCLVPMRIYASKVRKSARAMQSHVAELNSVMHETFTGNRIVKAYNLEQTMLGKFKDATRKFVSQMMRIVRANVREPMQVEGDIYACAASNDEGVRRLIEMMDEFEITNLDRLGDTIIEASREATLTRIRALPKGTYRNRLTMDGYEKPLVLNAALTISDEGLHVDFDGTSPASSRSTRA